MYQTKFIKPSEIFFNFTLCIFVYAFLVSISFADYDDEEALIELYGDEETISIATGTVQPISRAPAVASVITANDIKEIGATDIDEVLETVPGLHVARAATNNPIYTFRGVYTQANPQVLMLVNGIPITNLFVGDRNQIWGGMPVESISRIEVIRGPGSALYGADAFAGVINIVTKTAMDIDGVEVGSRLGKFDSRDVWALYGKKLGKFDVALMAEWGETDGHDEDVDSDFATGFGTSLAPDSINTEAENIDVRLDVSTGNWQLRAGLQDRKDIGLGAGPGEALTPSTYDSERWNVDLNYRNQNFNNWDLQAQTSYFTTSQETDENLQVFPPGTFGLPDGLISTPQVWERHQRYNFTALFTGFHKHSIRSGLGYTHSEIYKVEEEKNLGAGVVPGVLTDVSDTPFAFLPEKHRNNSFAFLQDVWQISNDWELTAGLRYDDYNDFGDTWNPRAALVWAARHDLTAKLLYGEAFRAPSFAEFRNQNNPVALGNTDLDPEEIKTLELAFDYRPKDNLKLGLNLFRYEWDDIIRFTDSGGGTLTAQNGGEQEGYGFEFEFDWKLSRTLNLLGNFAHQESEDKTTREDAGNAPENQFYVRTNWEFLPGWHIAPQWNFVLDRKRPPTDTRSDIDDYDMVDLTLRHKSFNDKWEFALSGRNIFNKRAFEPTSTSIVGDLPLARRSYFGEFRFNY